MIAARQTFLGIGGEIPEVLPSGVQRVEYVQRDMGGKWITDGVDSNGGYDIIDYLPQKDLQLFDFSVEIKASADYAKSNCDLYRLYQGIIASRRLFIGSISNPGVFYMHNNSKHDLGEHDLSGPFTFKAVYSPGSGSTIYFNGSEVRSYSVQSSSRIVTQARLLFGTGNMAEGGLMRLYSFKLGNTLDLIPVVRGNEVGFYNRVDGALILEEQQCLSGGPVIS